MALRSPARSQFQSEDCNASLGSGGLKITKAGNLAKTLFVVIAEPTDKAGERHAVLSQHLAYLDEIERTGSLFLAGPFVLPDGKSTGGGMFVLRAASLTEAEAIAARDPYNSGGYRTFQVRPWRLDQGAFSLGVSFSRGDYNFD